MIQVQKPPALHTDSRGAILLLKEIHRDVTSVLLITSNKGAVRANHYHKKDTHWTYLLSGKFRYAEKTLIKNGKIETITIHPGDMIISRPNIVHSMKFLEDSIMIVCTTERRNHKNYERDTVRVKLV